MMNEEKRLRILESKKRYREKNAKPKTALTQRVHDWFQCSCCLAKIGFGAKKASEIIGVISYGTIGGKWLELGVKRYRPPSGNWKQAISPTLSALKPKVEKPKIKKICAQKEYEAACMAEIRSSRRFFDWSYLWQKELSTRKSLEKYRSLNPNEKKRINKEAKLRILADPDRLARHKAMNKKWRQLNQHKVKAYQRESIRMKMANDAEGYRKARQDYVKKRLSTDLGFRIKYNMRRRLKDIMKTAKIGGSSNFSLLIGCTTEQLTKHLESQLKRGMRWDNYGTHWHVDHIIPCAAFDHRDRKQRAQCWHYTNLRPLEAKKNIEKRDTITEPQMSLLLSV